MRIEKILLATDLSPRAVAALPAVAGLAHQLSAEVELLYAHEQHKAPGSAAERLEQRDIEAHFQALTAAAAAWDLQPRRKVLAGAPAMALQAAAERDRHALLTLVHDAGHRGSASIARSLAARAVAPLLIVHAPMESKRRFLRPEAPQIRRIACAVDLAEGRTAVLEVAYALAQSLGAKLTLIYALQTRGAEIVFEGNRPHLSPPTGSAIAEVQAAQMRLSALAADLGDTHIGAHVVAASDVAAGIAAAALDAEADLLVVAPRQLGRVARMVLGSVTDRLLQLSPLPIWVMGEALLGQMAAQGDG